MAPPKFFLLGRLLRVTAGRQPAAIGFANRKPRARMPHSGKASNSPGLSLDERRQVRAGSAFGLGGEGPGVLLHQVAQRGLLRAVALVVNRCAIRRALGLPADGWHARPLKW